MICFFLYGIVVGVLLSLAVAALLSLGKTKRELREAKQRNEYLQKQKVL